MFNLFKKERRTSEGVRLRWLMEQIKTVRAMTQEQWIDDQIHRDPERPYIPRIAWIEQLEHWAMEEAERIAIKEAA